MAHPTFPRATSLLLGLSVLAGCASQPAHSRARATASQPPTETSAAPLTSSEPALEAPVALGRALHGAPMSEVVLDARAESAITLDVEGDVRLWTELGASDARAPLELPVREPSWMSLARDEDGFVAGFIDTAGGARVVRVQLDGSGARMSTLFERPATDPLFELHVLDGGERILALGIDHRVRLYDREGTEVSALEPMGFVPWQLRVQQRPGSPPAIVAVLAGPTRVQSIGLEDGRLVLRGEPRVVEIDQGPNRNDLSLSPDGRTVVAMRRPRARKSRFTFELVDLQTDERRLIAADVDTRDRPRVLLVDGERALLESGSGRGFWLDLSAAIPWTEGTDREQTERVPATAMREVGLPGSSSARRMHVALRAGVRAVPAIHQLLVDPVDDDRHVRLEAAPFHPRAVALNGEGTRIAWSTDTSIVLDHKEAGEAGESSEAVNPLPHPGGSVAELAFVGDDRLLVLDQGGHARIIDDQQGQVISSIKLPVGWGMSKAGFRRGDAFTEGALAVLSLRPQEPIHVVDVGDDGFGTVRDVPRKERTRWPQMGTRARDIRPVVETLGFHAVPVGSIEALVQDGRGHHLVVGSGLQPILHQVAEDGVTAILLREGFITRLEPDASGARVAVVQRVQRSEVFEDFRRVEHFDRYVVSVYDMETRQRLWSRTATGVADVEWSHDGQRLAVAAYDGGRVLEAATGDEVLVRRHLGLRAIEADDSDAGGR